MVALAAILRGAIGAAALLIPAWSAVAVYSEIIIRPTSGLPAVATGNPRISVGYAGRATSAARGMRPFPVPGTPVIPPMETPPAIGVPPPVRPPLPLDTEPLGPAATASPRDGHDWGELMRGNG